MNPSTIVTLDSQKIDSLIAKREGLRIQIDAHTGKTMYYPHPKLPRREWSPTHFWSQGGPLIEKYKIDLNWEWEGEKNWTATMEPDINIQAETLLLAAMRALVLYHHNKTAKK